jgi:NADH-quinone oxidoreductase subunit E
VLVEQDKMVAEQEFDLAPLDEMLDEFDGMRGAIIPILQRAQGIYGYLPQIVLQRISRRTGASMSQLYGVATFYAQFALKPRGRHLVDLCDGTACHVRGMPQIVTALENDLNVKAGDTTEDGRITLHVVFCLGSCALAPVAVIDGQIVGRLSPQKAVQLVRKLD